MVQIALLGEVQVSAADGSVVRVGGPRVRLLLALLALEPGRAVSCSALIGTIWSDNPPADPANALQTLVKRLRAVLPDGVAMEHAAASYRLLVDADNIDIHRFLRLVDEGTAQLAAGRTGTAARTLDAALLLWRGPAFADLIDVPDLYWHADRWNELRLDAVEARADAYLSADRGQELGVSLEHELRMHPLRESLAARVIRALAAGGQHSRAHEVFAATHRLLHAELGVVPSPELVRARDEMTGSADEPGSRLPARITSLIGREYEVEQVAAQLDTVRVLTLTGPGGVGKTSLAVEVATRLAPHWSGGCRLVELAAVGEFEPIAGAVLAQLGDLVRAEGPQVAQDSALGRVAARIGRRSMVLLLDNCEHRRDVATAISKLLSLCPNLTILATSRQPLGIDGETLFPVRPLALPPLDCVPADVLESAAVQLFLDRARTVRPGFVLADDNAATISAICRRLDGIPLALELAAARVRFMTPQQILDRLSDRFRLLVGNQHGAERHRSLHAAILGSWKTLGHPERRLARELATLPDGTSLDTLEQSCTGDVLGTLALLVSRSFVDFDGHRFRMLETIRAFTLETAPVARRPITRPLSPRRSGRRAAQQPPRRRRCTTGLTDRNEISKASRK
ncbi:putative ATPase/DNA-binding SARP family transcriptional activator [Nocardia sp. GAS34]|uniref:ATP-binding protein n=1 Tax=unclassified Nocardia TaxID=2637762 RepID=UPI003D25DAA3